MLNKILLPTDFSDNAKNAALYAFQLFQPAHFYLFNAYHVKGGNPFQSLETIKEIEQGACAQATAGLTDFQSKLMSEVDPAWLEGSIVEPLCRMGLAVEEIIGLDQMLKYEVIVMGTKGADDMASKLLGSNTSLVFDNVDKPVIAVPGNARFSGFKKLVLATDLKEDYSPALKTFIPLFRKHETEIILLHVENQDNHATSEDRHYYVSKAIQSLAYTNIRLEDLRGEDVEDTMHNYLEQTKPDALALVIRQRTFFQRFFQPSITREMSYRSHAPVLALHL